MAEDCQVRNWQTLLGPDHQLILIKLPLIELWAMSFHIELAVCGASLALFVIHCSEMCSLDRILTPTPT